MIILISYDLKGSERPSSYEKVRVMIEQNSISYKRVLYSQWLVETDGSIENWHIRMKDAADSDDNWFLVQVRRPYKGWLPKSVWTWLRERI